MLHAQDFTRAVEGIRFERQGQIAAFPFFGGLDLFLPQFVDIDGDGDIDLFVAESNEDSWRLSFFENSGTPQRAEFHWRAAAFDTLRIGNWYWFVDIDADGDADLYCANSFGGLRFYRNAGEPPQPRFVPETEQVLDTSGEAVASEPTSIPTFVDIDADGDFDFFTGVATGSIRMYRNSGTPAAPAFTYETETWQNLIIISGGVPQSVSTPVQTPQRNHVTASANRHGANGICFVDDDGDGDQDFFYGDLFHKSVYFLRNDGTPQSAKVAITDSLFPRPQAVQTNGFNIPRFADLEADGDFDFFTASIQQGHDNFLFYRNDGEPTRPEYRLTSENFLTMIDAGSANAPALADLDADGDQDLLCGDDEGFFIYYRNIGTATAPAFQWVSDNFQNLRPSGFFIATPAFVDIDADGDFDLFSGYHFGRIAFFENRGTPQLPNFALVTTAFENIDVGDQSAPHFADIDRDGDFDLFIGEARRNEVYLYENTGDARLPRLVLRKRIRNPVIVDESVPYTYDWNRDGILDLFLGNRLGTIVYHRGTAQPDSFLFVEEKFGGIDVGFASTPVFTDFDGDGMIDLLVGERAGGLNLFRGTLEVAVRERAPAPAVYELIAFPNPASDFFQFVFRAPNAAALPALTIFDALGEQIDEIPLQAQHAGVWTAAWRPASLRLAAGIYFAQIKTGQLRATRKLVLLR